MTRRTLFAAIAGALGLKAKPAPPWTVYPCTIHYPDGSIYLFSGSVEVGGHDFHQILRGFKPKRIDQWMLIRDTNPRLPQ